MLDKEGYDSLIQMIQTSHSVSQPIAVVRSNHATPKEGLECVKQLNVSLVLYNSELRKDLKSRGHLRVGVDANEKKSFAVHKTNHPLSLEVSRLVLNVKSLRVLHWIGAFPADCPLVRRILTAAR